MSHSGIGCHSIRQHPLSPIRRVSDAFGHSPEKRHQSRFKRIREEKREVESPIPHVAGDADPIPETGWFFFAPHLVHKRCRGEESGNPGPNQERDFSIGKARAHSLHCRDGEHRIANPIWPADEDLSDFLGVHHNFDQGCALSRLRFADSRPSRLVMSDIRPSKSAILAEIRT